MKAERPREVAGHPTVSVVLPMHDEEEVVDLALDAVRGALEGRAFEIICVDDGSRDATLARLEAAAAADRRLVVLSLSRNFGKEAALAAGLDAARGEAVLLMDADLQHPPDLIGEMIAKWEEGYDVVSAVKQARARESLLYRMAAATFNRLMGGAAGKSFRGSSDYKVLDRQVVEALAACPERDRFFRGLVTWVGFREATLPFTVRDRVAGKGSWTTFGLVRYSLKNLISFTSLPLRMVAFMGFATLLFAIGLGVQTLYRYVAGQAVSGFTTVILLQLIVGGLLLVSLGVIALYLAQIYDETKRRPAFIVRRPRPPRRARPPVSDSASEEAEGGKDA